MKIRNYINGEWIRPAVTECIDVINPVTGGGITKTLLCGKDPVEFFTQKKIVVERWPKEWSRRF